MLVNDFGESKVTIKKIEFLIAIESNRAQHEKDYQEAAVGFRAAAIEAMQRNLMLAQEGKEIKLGIALTIPVEHLKDYDRVIRMLTMSTADEITISEAQFTQYVMDDWGVEGGLRWLDRGVQQQALMSQVTRPARPDTKSSTLEIGDYLRRALNAAQFGVPVEELPYLHGLIAELETRAKSG